MAPSGNRLSSLSPPTNFAGATSPLPSLRVSHDLHIQARAPDRSPSSAPAGHHPPRRPGRMRLRPALQPRDYRVRPHGLGLLRRRDSHRDLRDAGDRIRLPLQRCAAPAPAQDPAEQSRGDQEPGRQGHPQVHGPPEKLRRGDGVRLCRLEGSDRSVQGYRLLRLRQGRHDRRALHDRRAERPGELGWEADPAVDARGDGQVQQVALARNADYRAGGAGLPGLQPPVHRRGLGGLPVPPRSGGRVSPQERVGRAGARARPHRRTQYPRRRRGEADADDAGPGGVLGCGHAQEHLSLRLFELALGCGRPGRRHGRRDGCVAQAGSEPEPAHLPGDCRRRDPSASNRPSRLLHHRLPRMESRLGPGACRRRRWPHTAGRFAMPRRRT
jgi:hypothetical protein